MASNCTQFPQLKTTYLKGKVNRRVDFLLNVLFRIEEDNFFNYRRKSQLPCQREGTRHQLAMAIPAEKIEVSLSPVHYRSVLIEYIMFI